MCNNQRKIFVNGLALATALMLALTANIAKAGVCGRLGSGANCVNSRDIKDNNLKAIDLKDEAGADFASGNQSVANVGSNVIVRSVTITAPAAGQVIVNASGVFDFDDLAAIESMTCSITTDSVVDNTHAIQGTEGAADAGERMPFAGTRGFVVAAGSTTFNLVCSGSGLMDVHDTSLTAIFVPTTY
ncbi:hypothetical protein MCAMS1_02054 [biofilm metagenome]